MLIAAAVALGAHAAPARSFAPTRAASIADRPAVVPEHYVVTPNGYFDPACVVTVARGEHVRADGAVQRADGSIRLKPACTSPHFSRLGDRVDADSGPREPTINQWVAWSDTTQIAATSSISATWTVPTAPSKQSGQVVYFFPGLEQLPTVVSIVQPVLGWDAFSDNAWTLSSWNCCITGTVYNSSPVTVAAGDVIYGVAQGSCASGTICSEWSILSEDVTSGDSTTLDTSADGQTFNWAFSGVLEAYGIRKCSEYPASGLVDFTGVSVLDYNQEPLTLSWLTNTTTAKPQCAYTVTVTATESTISLTPTGSRR